jgi:hypothetical protein
MPHEVFAQNNFQPILDTICEIFFLKSATSLLAWLAGGIKNGVKNQTHTIRIKVGP